MVNGFPVARHLAVPDVRIRIHDIDQSVCIAVVHSDIDIIDIVIVQGTRDHMDQIIIITAVTDVNIGKIRAVFFGSDLIPLFGGQAFVAVHDLPGDRERICTVHDGLS